MFKPRDLFTFEAVYVCFLYAGILKATPAMAFLMDYIDFTVATMLLSVYLAVVISATRRLPIHPSVLRYFLIYLVFVCWAVISHTAFGDGEYGRRKMAKLVFMTSWAVLAPLLIMGAAERTRRVLTLCVAMGLWIAVQGLLEGAPDSSEQLGALGTESYQPVGRSCGMGMVILLAFLSYEPSRLRRGAYTVAVGLLMVALLLSGTRQALVGVVVSLAGLVGILCFGADAQIKLKRVVAGILGLGLFVAVFATTLMPDFVETRSGERLVKLVRAGQEDGFQPLEENRPEVMRNAAHLWLTRPLVGVGYGNYAIRNTIHRDYMAKWPHNLFLEVLSELGFIGIVFFFPLVAIPFVTCLGAFDQSNNPLPVALACAWLFQLSCAMVSWDMNDNRILFAVGALIVANEGYRAIENDEE